MFQYMVLSLIINIYLIPNTLCQNLNFKFYHHPDRFLTFKEIVTKYGYPLEEHTVVTRDNYILSLYRIPHGCHSNITNKLPVILVHGMAGCADNYIAAGPYKALAYYLADRGYDVWLTNNRGSVYSLKHKYLNSAIHRKYWDFSWHEIATIDTPANIDYILEQTKQTQLFYVGHSQGTTTYFVLTSYLPEYNKKIKLAVQLGVSVRLGYTDVPVLKLIARFAYYINMALNFLQIDVIFPQNKLVVKVIQLMCSEVTVLGDFCRELLLFGAYSNTINKEILQIIFSRSPAGFSVKQLIHYLQLIDTGNFAQFDYGSFRNFLIYKSVNPTAYNLSLCTAPITIFVSKLDYFTPDTQLEDLEVLLPNIYNITRVDHYYHVDYVFGNDSDKFVNKPIVEMFRDIDTSNNVQLPEIENN